MSGTGIYEIETLNRRRSATSKQPRLKSVASPARQQAVRQPITWREIECASLADTVRRTQRQLDPCQLVPINLMREAYGRTAPGGVEATRLHRVHIGDTS